MARGQQKIQSQQKCAEKAAKAKKQKGLNKMRIFCVWFYVN